VSLHVRGRGLPDEQPVEWWIVDESSRGDGGTLSAEPVPGAAKAIIDADQVVIGPGSLYTSILAVAVVPALR